MKPTKVILTGGAGFIGSHLAEALLRQGMQLTIIDNLSDFYSPSRKLSNLEEVRKAGAFDFLQTDICDYTAMRRAFSAAQPDAVVHLAARAGVRPSIEQPLLYEKVNIGGTSTLLELCREFKVGKFIFGSSSSVYGATSRTPFSEDQLELRPISPYAATKLSGELLAYTYARLFALRVICLRFFTVYGPRQRPDLAIHKFTALLESGLPLPIYGDGSSGRDYTYIDDIVAGICNSLEHEPNDGDGVPFDVFNLGNSHPVTLAQLISSLERATQRTAIRQSNPMQLGDVPLTWADVSKAQRLLGFQPSVRLPDGLERFVSWYRESACMATAQAVYA